METKRRLFAILAICFIFFCASTYTLECLIANKVSLLLEKRLEHNVEETSKLITLQNSSVKSYVTENSYWDELCNSIAKNDVAWIAANMEESLKTPQYKGNFLWILDSSHKTVYNGLFNANLADKKIEPPAENIIRQFDKTKTTSFCYKVGGVYFDGYAASVVHGNDFAKKTAPVGFLLAGKMLNQDYLDQLHGLNTDFEYSFEPTSANIPANFVNKDLAQVTCYKTINCINGPPVIIKATSSVPEIKAYNLFVKIALGCFFLLILLVSFILYRYFFRYFFRPLERITVALQEKSVAPLKNVIEKNTEMGKIAKLIDTSFKQNGELQREIEHRKESEEELRLAVEKIHLSTVEK